MNILLVSPIPPPTGGIATWTEIFLESKIRDENNIFLLNSSVSGKRVKKINKISLYDELIRTVSLFKSGYHILKQNKMDIIHINTSCSKLGIIRDYYLMMFFKNFGGKLVVHFHCDVDYMIRNSIQKKYFNKFCLQADKIFCLNKSSQKYINLNCSLNSTLIPNFFSLNEFTIEEKKYNSTIKKIIFVGHVVKTKGFEEIIETAKALKEIEFHIIGHIGKDYRNREYPENIIMHGEKNKQEVLRFMNCADVLLFPSYTEGFPNVILEAMVCGLPIITTPVGAIPDMLEENGGEYVKIQDIDSIINAIENIKDLDIRKTMGEWSRNKALNNYAIDKVIETIMLEYKNF